MSDDLHEEPGLPKRNVPPQAIEARPKEWYPPVLAGHEAPAVAIKLESFRKSVAGMFEAFIARRENPHTQRAYRQDILSFARFVGIPVLEVPAPRQKGDPPPTLHPDEASLLLKCSVSDVQAWRDFLAHDEERSPATVLRRITSLSRFYEYIREQVADARLPVVAPNPAHKSHIPRHEPEPVAPTTPLSEERVRQLKQIMLTEASIDLPFANQMRAAFWFYLYTGARISTGCRMRVEDCRFQEQQNPYVLLKEKGRKEGRRPVGLNHEAVGVIREHLESSGFTSGPLFRARLNSRSKQFAATAVDPATMYRWLQKYLERLPNAIEEYERSDGTPGHRCIYTPHSLRHTTATLLDRAGVDIASIQKLLGHKQVTTTQRYIQRNDGTEDSASHKIPY